MLVSSHNNPQYKWFIVPIITVYAADILDSATRIRLSQKTKANQLNESIDRCFDYKFSTWVDTRTRYLDELTPR
jgi:hypothetical protein